MMLKILKNFGRKTSSGSYIPEIDGLRFLAIFSVLIFHAGDALSILHKKSPLNFPGDLNSSIIYRFIENGRQGVELFFAISGFILALPFILQYRYSGKELSLKQFYLRRVTRLEPPYIIALILLFIGGLITHEYSPKELVPSFFASLVYIHGFLFKGLPKVTTIIWSLEVEVQFYLLVPLLMRVFLYSKNVTRIILIVVILAMPLVQNLVHTNVNSLFKYFQYFAAGILLADIYLDKQSIIYKLNHKLGFVLGFVFLFLLLWCRTFNAATFYTDVSGSQLPEKMTFPFLVLAFYSIVLGNPIWKKIFSLRVLTTLGGMCYSIYLLHTAVISICGKCIFKLHFTNNVLLQFLVCFLILLIPILLVASLFFKLIEQPCMDKNWYKKIWGKKLNPIEIER